MVIYKHGWRLVGDRTAKSRLSELLVTESQFVDDTALYATSRNDFETVTSSFIQCASEWGLTVSIPKIKEGTVTDDGADTSPVCVGGDSLKVID